MTRNLRRLLRLLAESPADDSGIREAIGPALAELDLIDDLARLAVAAARPGYKPLSEVGALVDRIASSLAGETKTAGQA